MPVTLREVAVELRRRGEHEEAEYCELVIPFELILIHDFTFDEVLDMTVDEVEAWYGTPPKPLKYIGWNFTWGLAA